jgi:DNA repair protein RecN (Recombination protein N)
VERLVALERGEEGLSLLEEQSAAHQAAALEAAAALTEARRAAAPALERAVAQQLAGLSMSSASLVAALQTRPEWAGLRESGADSVEFLLAANVGQTPRSLARTASGGELSRVLLALKCALAGAGGDETLVFDEIDAGIGGRTAVSVAQKLSELAGRSQVIVVTHLAHVDGEAVVEELCRMMGGDPGDAEAMAHARDLRAKGAARA